MSVARQDQIRGVPRHSRVPPELPSTTGFGAILPVTVGHRFGLQLVPKPDCRVAGLAPEKAVFVERADRPVSEARSACKAIEYDLH
jgi:hypothetical protein